LFERARVVAEEDVDLVCIGEALERGPLECSGAEPAAIATRGPDGTRAALGEAAQAADAKTRS
jgi:hypothetical protein